MKGRIGLLIGILLLIGQSANSMGWGDWGYTTKNGTRFIGDGGVWLQSKGIKIYVKKWYYYKDHIIGHYHPQKYDDRHKGQYFILDENSNEFSSYDSKNEWENSIENKGLDPIITRWFSQHYGLNTFLILMVLYTVGCPFIMLPLYYLLFLFLKKVFWEERLNFDKLYTRIFLSTSTLIIVRVFLISYVQSF